MPIYLAAENQSLIIKNIMGSDKMKAHLQTLGFIVGETVMVVNKVDNNVIVKIKGVSIAISMELAKRILV